MTFRVGTVTRTGYGTPVEIIAVLPPGQEAGDDAIVGVLIYSDGSREIGTWRRDGRFRGDKITRLDLALPEIGAMVGTVVDLRKYATRNEETAP